MADLHVGFGTKMRRRWDEEKRPLMFRLKGTVILKIWWQICIMALYTGLVVTVHEYIEGMRMNFPLTLVPVLGVVTGLLLVFRTNTAYDRYWEGRRLWSEMTYRIRHLTCAIWAGIDDTVVKSTGPDDQAESVDKKTARLIIEKTSAINLLIAFAYATKNYLRQEYSYDEADMKDLISHLPRFQTPSSNQSFDAQSSFRSARGGSARAKRKSVDLGTTGNSINLGHTNCGSNENGESKSSNILFYGRGDVGNNNEIIVTPPNPTKCHVDSVIVNNGGKKVCHVTEEGCPTNIPIEISYYLFSYVRRVSQVGAVDASLTRVMYDALIGLVQCLTGFERILRTPIPLAYGVHLHQAVWLYLLALPYQLVQHLRWFTIPAVSLASFALLGILGIGWEIENPFGYDDNDLPLDDFCKVIRREVQVIVGRPLPSVDSWINSRDNHPLAPQSWLGADELLAKSGKELADILAQDIDPQVPLHLPNGKKSRDSTLNVSG